MIYEVLAGGIYKIPFPFTDLSGKKARPALALTYGVNDVQKNEG